MSAYTLDYLTKATLGFREDTFERWCGAQAIKPNSVYIHFNDAVEDRFHATYMNFCRHIID